MVREQQARMIRNARGRLLDPCLRLIAGELLTVWGLACCPAKRRPGEAPQSSVDPHCDGPARQAAPALQRDGEGAFRGTSDVGIGCEPTVHYEGCDPRGNDLLGNAGARWLDTRGEGLLCMEGGIRTVATPLAAAGGVVQNDARVGQPGRITL